MRKRKSRNRKRKHKKNKKRKHGSRSRSERLLFKLLKTEYPSLYIKQQDRDLLNPYELDITIPELQIAIEWNGIFHYQPINSKTKLRKTQKKDRLKQKLLYEMNWTFYVVRHESKFNENIVNEHFETIQDIIDDKLNS